MLLAVDIGNTNIDVGVFDGHEVRATWRIASDVERLADEYAVSLLGLLRAEGLEPSIIHEAVMCSSVPDLVAVFDQLCRRYFGVQPLVVGPGTRTGVRILYEPRELGADRVVDVVAALKLHGPPPLIIVDLGTATVFDAVSPEGDYLGGAIAPGIGIAAQALYERTAKLYRVELEHPRAVIGKNTVNAIQSGIMFGYVALVEIDPDRSGATDSKETITQREAYRTGNISWIRSKVWDDVFNVPLPDPPLCFVGADVTAKLQSMQPPEAGSHN